MEEDVTEAEREVDAMPAQGALGARMTNASAAMRLKWTLW